MNLITIHGKIGAGKDDVGRIIQVLTSETYYKQLEPILQGSKEKGDILKMDWGNFMEHNKDLTDFQFYGLFNSYEIKKFAWPLKKVLGDITSTNPNKFNDRDFKKEIDPYLRLTYGQALQDVGESLRESIYKDIWVDALFRNFDETSKWVITDLRYMNEFEAVADYEGLIVKVIGVEEDDGRDKNHSSEVDLDELEDHNFDFVIDNTVRDDNYKSLVSQVYDFLKEYNLIPE